MAILRQVVFAATTGDATIAALIGTRCYPDRLPENCVFPAISFNAHVSDNDADYRTHEVVAVPRSVARVQFNCYAETGDGADALASAVLAFWSGYRDLPDVGGAQVANRIDSYEPAVNRYRAIADVMIEYQR